MLELELRLLEMSFISSRLIDNFPDEWVSTLPFPYLIIDDFFEQEIAHALEEEFPKFDAPLWHEYGNELEVKKVCNDWNKFPPVTYQTLQFLNSETFINLVNSKLFKMGKVFSDSGLNGGGWHIHGQGGKLNTHLDYSLHPKLFMQRKFNIII